MTLRVRAAQAETRNGRGGADPFLLLDPLPPAPGLPSLPAGLRCPPPPPAAGPPPVLVLPLKLPPLLSALPTELLLRALGEPTAARWKQNARC